jgi:hypothetical protein
MKPPPSTVDKLKSGMSSVLERHGFRLVAEYDLGGFGDAEAYYATPEMRIRLSSDRSVPVIEFAANFAAMKDRVEWFDLDLMRCRFEPGRIMNEKRPDNVYAFDLSELVTECNAFIDEQYDAIAQLLSPGQYDRTVQEMRDLRSERTRKLFPGWPG